MPLAPRTTMLPAPSSTRMETSPKSESLHVKPVLSRGKAHAEGLSVPSVMGD